MIPALAVLLVFQLIGEILVTMTRVPIPGPVAGLALLFLFLRLRGEMPVALKATAETLLSHLPLLFVPAGVGVMQHFSLLSREWVAILLALAVSTVLSLAVTAIVVQMAARRFQAGGRADG